MRLGFAALAILTFESVALTGICIEGFKNEGNGKDYLVYHQEEKMSEDLEKELPKNLNIFEFVYETELTKRIDAVHNAPFYFTWINTAWAVMQIKQGILPEKYTSELVAAILELWENPVRKYSGFGGLQSYVMAKKGQEVGGSLTMGRTIPPLRQMFSIRHRLMKVMCTILDYQDALLDTAEKHLDAVMPGYTHYRHAQPMTFGHYLLSVYDPGERIYRMIEDSYHAMSLNELGCGALAGTSWPIDRNMVSEYLGLEGLIENANDAVAYTDGYVLLVSALTNFMAVHSRMALDLNIWSGLEYNFMHVPWFHGGSQTHSHMMPNKIANAPYPERSRVAASELLGDLMEIASMGIRAPHGDTHEMLHMRESTQRALTSTHKYLHPYIYVLPRITVYRDKMLEMARKGYSCATELANQIVRDHDLSYRTAHKIVNEFVIASAGKNIPASEARIDLLEAAAKKVIGRELGMSEEMLRKCLDPVHFVEITNSQGGVAPDETARMLAERRKNMKVFWARHVTRIEKLEKAKERLLADLKEINKKYNPD